MLRHEVSVGTAVNDRAKSGEVEEFSCLVVEGLWFKGLRV